MIQTVAAIIAGAGALYALIGLAFGLGFVLRWIERLDPAAAGSPLSFRLLILPGAAALWPALAAKLLASRREGRV